MECIRKSWNRLRKFKWPKLEFCDIVTATMPLHVVRLLCGLHMVFWTRDKKNRKYFYPIMGIIAFINQPLTHMICTIYTALFSKELNDIYAISGMVQTGHYVQLFCFQVVMLSVTFLNYKNYKLKIELYDSIMRVDKFLKAIGIIITNKGLFLLQIAFIGSSLILILYQLVMDDLLIKEMVSADQAVALTNTSLYPILCSSPTGLEFLVFTWALRERFSRINDRLNGILVVIKQGVPSKVCPMHKWRRYLKSLRECEIMLHLYKEMSDIADGVNRILGMSIFIIISYAFINSLFTIFMTLKLTIEHLRGHGDPNVYKLANQQNSWNLLMGTTCFFIVVFSEKAKSQANETHLIVQRILRYCEYEPLKRQLKMFGLKRLHCEVQFKVVLLVLNYELVYEVIASSAMYLIILLQFELA